MLVLMRAKVASYCENWRPLPCYSDQEIAQSRRPCGLRNLPCPFGRFPKVDEAPVASYFIRYGRIGHSDAHGIDFE